MIAAGTLFLLGCGLTAAGMLWSGLYDIGIVVLIVAAIGLVVRIGDWARVILARPQASEPHVPVSPQRGRTGEFR